MIASVIITGKNMVITEVKTKRNKNEITNIRQKQKNKQTNKQKTKIQNNQKKQEDKSELVKL